jgi:voltage-gated potassium channel Kch
MSRKAGPRARFRYWFDNTMSRGTGGLIVWLAVASAIMIIAVTAGLELVDPGEAGGNPFLLLWQNFVATFSLGAPGDGKWPALLLWFLLGVGGIFIVSALVGLLTSGLHRQLEQLRKGRSQVIEKDHTVILGWSDQIYTVINELVEANRSRRRAAIAILADEDKVLMEDMVRHRIRDTGRTRLVFRTGSPLDLSDLEMVNLNQARAIIVLGPNSSSDDADAFVLKVLLAINKGPAFRGRQHHVVASVRDGRNRAVAKLAGGDAVVLDGDDIGARLIVQTARQSKLSVVYQELFDFGGDEIYMISEPKLVGRQFGQALQAYRKACPIGLIGADGRTTLVPPMETVIGPTDRIVLVAEDDSKIKLSDKASFSIDEANIVHSARGPAAPEKTLILGWNGRATRIIEQLEVYVAEGSMVDVVSDRSDVDMAVSQLVPSLRRLNIRSKAGDTRDRRVLETLDVGAYHSMIVLSDDALDPLSADSRVLVTLLHLRDILASRGRSGSIVSEMRDDRDRELAQLTKADDFVVSEQLVSLLLTQISENRHLESVFADLFDADGAEIYIRPSTYYLRPKAGYTFATIVEAARRRGEVAIGYRLAEPGDGHGVVVNPDKYEPLPMIDRVIVLAHS